MRTLSMQMGTQLGMWMVILTAPALLACSDNAPTTGFMDSAWAQTPPADARTNARTDAWLETIRVAGLAKPEPLGAVQDLATAEARFASTHPTLLRGPFADPQPTPALPARNDGNQFASL